MTTTAETTQLKLESIPYHKLFEMTEPLYHQAINELWADPDVHYLALFSNEEDSEKAIVTVGPELEYSSLEGLEDVVIDGLKPIAFARSRHAGRKGGFTRMFSDLFSKRVNTRVAREEMEKEVVTPPVEPVEKSEQTPKPAPSDEAFEKRLQELEQKEKRLKQIEELLTEREAFLAVSEDNMLKQTENHMVREAELEGWEESLAMRERLLREKEIATIEHKREPKKKVSTPLETLN